MIAKKNTMQHQKEERRYWTIKITARYAEAVVATLGRLWG
jgi:hypothetical protein